MPELIITPLRACHTPALHTLLRAQLEEERALFYKPSLLTHEHTSDDTIRRVIAFWQEHSAIAVFVAENDIGAYGFIAAQIKNDIYNNQDVLSGEILAVYVSEQQRKRGVGRGLIAHAETWFRQNAVHAVNVSWLEGNDASQALYASFGFEPVHRTARKPL